MYSKPEYHQPIPLTLYFLTTPLLKPLRIHCYRSCKMSLVSLPFPPLENEFHGELVNQRWTRGERTSSRCQASLRLQSRRPIMVSDKPHPHRKHPPPLRVTRTLHQPLHSASWAFPNSAGTSRKGGRMKCKKERVFFGGERGSDDGRWKT